MSKVIVKINLALLLCLSIILSGCLTETPPTFSNDSNKPSGKIAQSVINADNKFGLKLFKKISKEEKNKNVFISPMSIAMALGMVLNGADSATFDSISKTLEFTGLTYEEINNSYRGLIDMFATLDPKVTLHIANSIWYRQGFKVLQNFVDINKDYFDAEIDSLNFNSQNAAKIINNWVKENTKNKIEEIVDSPINSATVMFLINALYFKGNWMLKFDTSKTINSNFYISQTDTVSCKLMYKKDNFLYSENDEFQAVELFYGDSIYSMVVLLPKQDKNIDSLINKLNNDKWNNWLGNLNKREINLWIPKFKLEYEIELKKALSSLGMGIAFSGSADFSKIDGKKDLYISKVKHKTFVEVNEEGTEAAAVTSIEIRLTSMPIQTTMRINRPFIFAIKERKTGSILFIGKILNPAE